MTQADNSRIPRRSLRLRLAEKMGRCTCDSPRCPKALIRIDDATGERYALTCPEHGINTAWLVIDLARVILTLGTGRQRP